MLSETYRQQLAKLHEDKPDFGTSSVMYVPILRQVIKQFQPEELLDYGCGKMALKDALGIADGYVGYDPAIPGVDAPPTPTDMVVCTDVLEHVEPEYLDTVLDDLRRVTKQVGFYAVHTGAALNHLPDGRNAHLIQEPPKWWLPKIIDRFELIQFQLMTNGFWVLVR